MSLQRKSLRAVIFVPVIVLLGFPAEAHKTEVSGDIAGIWHVEPNHSPKAGEPARVWVALTKKGGAIVPLEQCDCRLGVYQGSATTAEPILEPSLQAIAAENYRGIPGAEVIFPQIGQYQLQLTGRPRGGASFRPFELNYSVTVAAGKSPATPPATEGATDSTPSGNSQGALAKALLGLGAIALASGAVGFALLRPRSTKR